MPRKRFQSSLVTSKFPARPAGKVILIPVGADERDLPETAVGDLFARLREVLPAALLEADLHDALGLAHRGDHRFALFQSCG